MMGNNIQYAIWTERLNQQQVQFLNTFPLDRFIPKFSLQILCMLNHCTLHTVLGGNHHTNSKVFILIQHYIYIYTYEGDRELIY